MMYSEFVAGTGCKENAKNYEVFKNLEVMYMNTDMTKAEIYEYGKKLVDNSKSEEELKVEAEIKAEIAEHKEQLEECRSQIKIYEESVAFWKEAGEKELAQMNKRVVQSYKETMKFHRNRIAELKWILNG